MIFQRREQENSVSRKRLCGNDDGSVEAEKEKDRKLAEKSVASASASATEIWFVVVVGFSRMC